MAEPAHAPTLPPALEVVGLEVAYGGIRAVKGISFEVRAGELVSLIGANGAGKTTTLKALTGLLPAGSGDIRLHGVSIRGRGAWDLARQGLVMVPEGRGIFARMNITENLLMGAFTRRDDEVESDMERVFGLFARLKDRCDQLGGTLSGGEQQMLAIGRALMTNPHLLILDEATEGLAPLIREEIWQCLAALKGQGQTILVIDKYVERLIKIADRHTIIERGRVAWQGSSAELDADHGLWHRYLGV